MATIIPAIIVRVDLLKNFIVLPVFNRNAKTEILRLWRLKVDFNILIDQICTWHCTTLNSLLLDTLNVRLVVWLPIFIFYQ